MTSAYRVIDITRELLSTPPYPGDDAPSLKAAALRSDMAGFLTQYLTTSLHGATHFDAPLHLCENGTDVAAIELASCMGSCIVTSDPSAKAQRLLLRGVQLSAKQAEMLDCILIGTDKNSIALPRCEKEVHRILFEKGIVILENLNLDAASDGEYTLVALPLKIRGGEASPTRAILIK